jgi:hypothetical protein
MYNIRGVSVNKVDSSCYLWTVHVMIMMILQEIIVSVLTIFLIK